MTWRFGTGPLLLAGLATVACLGGRSWGGAPSTAEVRWSGLLHDAALGDVHLVKHDARPSRIVLFVTGDGGWDADAADIAERLAETDALVAGIDVGDWRDASARAGYPCIDFADALGHLAARLRPEARNVLSPVVLAGHSAGATIVYLALAQAPAHRFAGAVSMGFAPVLEFPTTPCAAAPFVVQRETSSTFRIAPRNAALHGGWWVLQGMDDDVTPPADARPFAALVRDAHYLPLTGQGHSFAGHSGWLSSALRAMESLAPETRAHRDVVPVQQGALP